MRGRPTWDAVGAPVEVVAALAERLLRAGCVVACCWGSDCERVHDVFDEVDLELHDFLGDGTVVTTWHDDEPLEDAVAFLLDAEPFPPQRTGCGTVLAMVIGSRAWADVVRARLAEP